MTASEVAELMGVSKEEADAYLASCTDVVEDDLYVATLKDNTVHIFANVKGLSGRLLLRRCLKTLEKWFENNDVLYAPVRHGNEKAVNLARALGFHQYAETYKHVWLMQTKEQFHES